MIQRIEIELPADTWEALRARASESEQTPSQLAASLLTTALDDQKHSIYQVSTSGALVKGVFDGAVSVRELLEHGDFGLGTFAGLDGELIMVDGQCFRATAEGAVNEVRDDAKVPFAMVTRFVAHSSQHAAAMTDFSTFTGRLDRNRPSNNVFAAIRGRGKFQSLTMRAACPAHEDEGLLEATKHQSEFRTKNTTGVLVGFWAPDYAGTVSVPGYHFHFIDDDRDIGGHVLAFENADLDIEWHTETGIHLAIPKTRGFLEADLTGDHTSELDEAETRVRGEDG